MLVIITFIIVMMGMVYYATLQSNEMFDDNYYEKELKYQELIDASSRLKAVSKVPVISQNKESLIITLPENVFAQIKDGTIELLNTNDHKGDLLRDLKPDSSGIQLISKSSLKRGQYKVRVKWLNDTTLYYTEHNILVD